MDLKCILKHVYIHIYTHTDIYLYIYVKKNVSYNVVIYVLCVCVCGYIYMYTNGKRSKIRKKITTTGVFFPFVLFIIFLIQRY